MSPENVDVQDGGFGGVQLDIRIPVAASSEIVASRASPADTPARKRGGDAARRFWQEWFSAWQTIDFDYELLDAADKVVMLFDLTMRGRSTGLEMPFGKVAWVGSFNDGRVVQMKP